MDGSNAGADERGDTLSRRLPTPLAGAAIAAGAVSLGLVLIGACGLGGQDTYVPPPPLNADLQAAPVNSASGTGSTTPVVVIPPSPSWRVAAGEPRQPRTTTSAAETTEPDPDPEDADTTTSSRTTTSRPPRTTRPRPTTTERTTTESTRPTTTEPERTTEPPTTAPTTSERSAAIDEESVSPE
ncbi:hypothetical protein [Nocardia huaxiensis]|uniref:Uncharacterized protein n=1 Tax=Nocardia huaxiensis TaxID=2755382 RepID=A0A7D6ZJX0_9NOCA|nr:hypothetical protein [Nocardia huaxiensis]QLY32879.1 hypothetical protein H0264_12075 [Nocardia huaxiensis]UFS93365.1 hypothetical protein LPY97_21265 [Nocardia huaxiensis]